MLHQRRIWRKADGAMYKIRAVSSSPVRSAPGSARYLTPGQFKSAGRASKGRVGDAATTPNLGYSACRILVGRAFFASSS
jgi:hypothetical protein